MNREQLVAVAATLGALGADVKRVPLSSDDAVQLARECEGEALAVAVAALDLLNEQPEPADFEARLAHLKAKEAAYRDFWQVFEGAVVEGVEIIKKR